MTVLGRKNVVDPADLMDIPVGSIIMVGERRPEASSRWSESKEPSFWHVFTPGKAALLQASFPNTETEDLDWFEPWYVVQLPLCAEFVRD